MQSCFVIIAILLCNNCNVATVNIQSDCSIASCAVHSCFPGDQQRLRQSTAVRGLSIHHGRGSGNGSTSLFPPMPPFKSNPRRQNKITNLRESLPTPHVTSHPPQPAHAVMMPGVALQIYSIGVDTRSLPFVRVRMQACSHVCTHAPTHAPTHTHPHTQTPTRAFLPRTETFTCTCTPEYTHASTHSRPHTHNYTHTQSSAQPTHARSLVPHACRNTETEMHTIRNVRARTEWLPIDMWRHGYRQQAWRHGYRQQT